MSDASRKPQWLWSTDHLRVQLADSVRTGLHHADSVNRAGLVCVPPHTTKEVTNGPYLHAGSAAGRGARARGLRRGRSRSQPRRRCGRRHHRRRAHGSDRPDAETTEETGEDGATGTVTVDTASTDLGEILVDGDGMTLYLFDNDTADKSVCTDDCAVTWPPLVGEPEVAGNADASLVGTITRPDGATHVTYAGHPLYRYTPDGEPGDVTGQGVGGVWWVVGPDGNRITAEAAGSGRPDY